MTARSIEFIVPRGFAAPRGAEWAAALWMAIGRAGRALWRAMEEVGQRRAASHLRQLALRWQHVDPELAHLLRQASRREGQP